MYIQDIKPEPKYKIPINNISTNEDIIYEIEKNDFESQRIINLKKIIEMKEWKTMIKRIKNKINKVENL